MDNLPEEIRKNEIRRKIKEFNYHSAIVECALFREGVTDDRWNIYVLKITFDRRKPTGRKRTFLKRDDLVLFKCSWSLVQINRFLDAIQETRKTAQETGKHPPENDRFDLQGHPVRIYGNYPGEMRFVGSQRAWSPLRMKEPYYLAEYALFRQQENAQYIRLSLDNEDPPFSGPAHAVNHHFYMFLDTNSGDFRNGWVGMVLPTYGGRITGCVAKQKTVVITTETSARGVALSIISQDANQRSFSRKIPARPHVSIRLGFDPACVDISLFKGNLKIDSWRWIKDSGRHMVGLMSNAHEDNVNGDLQPSEGITAQLLGDRISEHGQLDFEALLHPLIRKSSYKQFCDGHLRDAVLNSVVAVFDLMRKRTGLKSDGRDLVGEVLSASTPHLILSELDTESGRNDQVGFLQILQGAYQGIRNPKAHSLEHDLDRLKAAQHLVFSSLLARRISEARETKHKSAGKRRPAPQRASKKQRNSRRSR